MFYPKAKKRNCYKAGKWQMQKYCACTTSGGNLQFEHYNKKTVNVVVIPRFILTVWDSP